MLKKYVFSRWYILKVSNLTFIRNPIKVSITKKPLIRNNHHLPSLSFYFLNQKVSFEKDIKWNETRFSKLILYNLHYFDYILRDFDDFSPEMFEGDKKIIRSWIMNNPVGFNSGWDPYPLSLRIVNWIFYYSTNNAMFDKDQKYKQMYLNSLYRQCAYLSHFLEFHILANHLLKNGKALLFGGYFFDQKKWIQIGEKILGQELHEQILSDGGHFERSPMYHCIALEDVLDIVNLKKGLDKSPRNLDINQLKDITQKMLKWLHTVIHPDMEIPLLNDSALQTAPSYTQLREYYNTLFTDKLDLRSEIQLELLDASGYFIFRSSDQFLIVDGGKLGVDYQPGHAHCDIFSYEYSFNNKRFIVDTGIGEYLNSEIRQKARSIQSHNCVVVNNMEQAEIWQTFRMGRRVKPNSAETYTEKNISKFNAIYENRLSKKRAYRHQREIVFLENKFFHFKDHITGKKINSLISLIHFHPDCNIEFQEYKIKISHSDYSIYIFLSNTCYSVKINDWFYVPEFGKILPSIKIEIKPVSIENDLIEYLIVPSVFLQSADYYFTNRMVV